MKKTLSFHFVLLLFLSAEVVFSQNFTGTELLGRPTDNSVTINIICDAVLDIYFEYGSSPGNYSLSTNQISTLANEPFEVIIDGLSANTRYYYRMAYSTDGGTSWIYRDEHSFITQRTPSSTFTFTIISDSHLGQYGGNTDDQKALYQQTLFLMLLPISPTFILIWVIHSPWIHHHWGQG